jgi:diguanylate cyclase (GGDEF)-like protein
MSTISAFARWIRPPSSTDPLTGLLNRRAFDTALSQQLSRSARDERPCTLVVLDVDDFESIDAGGRAAGKRALRLLATALLEEARQGDAVGRLGGEEFGVVLAGSDALGACQFGERLRHRFSAIARPDGLPTTASLGVAAYPAQGLDPEALAVAADHALHAAKAAGRDRTVVAPNREAFTAV